jgi:NADH-quinone oxidoreductase subunit H
MTLWLFPLLKLLFLIFLFVMPLASLLTWMERRQSAMIQDRLGPTRANIGNVRAWGLLHVLADGLKMFFKEDFRPAKANPLMHTLAPALALMPALIVFAVVPFGDTLYPSCLGQSLASNACGAGIPLQVAHLDVGILFVFAIASLAVYGAALAGWSSYNNLTLLGSLRAAAQMISYEVTMGLTLVGALLIYGTLEPMAMVRAQTPNPLHWGIVAQPLGFILFCAAAIAETKRAPFDLPEGESEIVGYFVEYSGMKFGMFYLAEFIEIIVASALITTVFLGGWQVPFLYADGFHIGGRVFELKHLVVTLLQLGFWGFKVFFLCWLQLMIRWTLPRFRYDQLMRFGWKGLLPASLLNIFVTAVVLFFWNRR